MLYMCKILAKPIKRLISGGGGGGYGWVGCDARKFQKCSEKLYFGIESANGF